MEPNAILGNERLRANLSAAVRGGRIGHFYILSGPAGSGKRTLARYLSAAILCAGREKPCYRCEACRKVLAGTHPDVITVDNPDNKTVTVDLAREARADAFIMPNESDHKIYLIPRADAMNPNAQNALLKVLEEPPSYAVFLLLSENSQRLLPTIRSRAEELRLSPLSEPVLRRWLREKCPNAGREAVDAAIARSGGFAGQALALLEKGTAEDPRTDALVEALCTGDDAALLTVLVSLEKSKRDALAELLERWLSLTEEALAGQSGLPAVSPGALKLSAALDAPRLAAVAGELRKMLLYLQSNVSPGAVIGYLTVRLSARE